MSNIPDLPDDHLPSSLHCQPASGLSHEARTLIQQCRTSLEQGDGAALDAIDVKARDLVSRGTEPDACSVVWIHVGDACLACHRLALALRAYSEAEEILKLLSRPEDRYNEAAAIYGQGLVHQSMHHPGRARRDYQRALSLFEGTREYWGIANDRFHCGQCAQIVAFIECQREALASGGNTRPLPGTTEEEAPMDSQQPSGPRGDDTGTVQTEDLGAPMPKPVVRSVYPGPGDTEIMPSSSLLIHFDRPVDSLKLELVALFPQRPIDPQSADHEKPVLGSQTWSADRTIVRVGLGNLMPRAEYEIVISGVQHAGGNGLDSERLLGSPDRWRFRTAALSAGPPQLQTWDVVLMLIAIGVVLAGVALFIAFWLSWAGAVALVVSYGLTVFFAMRAMRQHKVVFALGADQETVLEVQGQLVVWRAQQGVSFRWPWYQKLRAIMPTSPQVLQMQGCEVEDAQNKKHQVSVELRYRVANSLHAYRAFCDTDGDDKEKPGVCMPKDVRKAFEEKLSQCVGLKGTKIAMGVAQYEIEEQLLGVLLLDTLRWGVEILEVQLLNIKSLGENGSQ